MNNHKKFGCAMTYHGISINQNGTLDPCCQYARLDNLPVVGYGNMEYFTNTIRSRMREDARKGIQHAGCKKCWHEEEQGLTSLRQFSEKWYPIISDDFFVLVERDVVENVPVYHLELRLGNFCNLKCIMCTEGSSSSILAERYSHSNKFAKIGIYPHNPKIPPWWEDWHFLDFCDQRLKKVKRVNFTGGEPFLIPEVISVLERLDKNVTVSFNTNLTQVTDQVLSQLKQFSTVEIVVSLEGIGPMNDYVRYPSNWNDIADNFNKVMHELPHASVAVNHTLQHTSVYALPALAEWLKSTNRTFYMTTVQGYPYLNFNSVPVEYINKFLTWCTNTTALDEQQRVFLKNHIAHSKFDEQLHQQFQEYIAVLDSIRNTNFEQVFLK